MRELSLVVLLLLVSGCATISSYDHVGASGKIKVTGVVSAVAGVEVGFTVGATREGTEVRDATGTAPGGGSDLLDALPGLLLGG